MTQFAKFTMTPAMLMAAGGEQDAGRTAERTVHDMTRAAGVEPDAVLVIDLTENGEVEMRMYFDFDERLPVSKLAHEVGRRMWRRLRTERGL